MDNEIKAYKLNGAKAYTFIANAYFKILMTNSKTLKPAKAKELTAKIEQALLDGYKLNPNILDTIIPLAKFYNSIFYIGMKKDIEKNGESQIDE